MKQSKATKESHGFPFLFDEMINGLWMDGKMNQRPSIVRRSFFVRSFEREEEEILQQINFYGVNLFI
jgi:hypothetical protein